MGANLVTFYPRNAERGLETHMALVALFDPSTGAPLVVMDGTYLTEMRTAAVSAAATRRSRQRRSRSRHPRQRRSGRSHLDLLSRLRSFEEVRIWSPTRAHVERFVEAARQRHAVRIVACDSAEATVRGADVVVTATSATEPVLRGAWLEPGAHVDAVGACVAGWRELDDDVMRHVVYVDSRAAAAVESGDVILSKCPVYAELGELFAGAVPRAPTRPLSSSRWAWRSRMWLRPAWCGAPIAASGSGEPFACSFSAPTTVRGRIWPRLSCAGSAVNDSRSRVRERTPVASIPWLRGHGRAAASTWGNHRSKHVDELTGQTFDYVITVCDAANESCPIFPGTVERIHWSIADPSVAEGTQAERLAAFERAADELRHSDQAFRRGGRREALVEVTCPASNRAVVLGGTGATPPARLTSASTSLAYHRLAMPHACSKWGSRSIGLYFDAWRRAWKSPKRPTLVDPARLLSIQLRLLDLADAQGLIEDHPDLGCRARFSSERRLSREPTGL